MKKHTKHIHVYQVAALAEVIVESNDTITDEESRKLALDALDSGFIGESDFKKPDANYIVLSF